MVSIDYCILTMEIMEIYHKWSSDNIPKYGLLDFFQIYTKNITKNKQIVSIFLLRQLVQLSINTHTLSLLSPNSHSNRYTFLQFKLRYALCSLKYFTKYKIKANQNFNQQFACLLVLISSLDATTKCINNNYVTP